MVLPALSLAIVAPALLLAVVVVGLRLAAAVGARIDAAVERDAPLAEVTELPLAHELASLPWVVEPEAPPAVPAVERGPLVAPAAEPGPLQLVDADEPTTKRCPDCAETVLAAARVCKHCHYRFGPPLHGSWAV